MNSIWACEVGGLTASRIVGVKYRTLDNWLRTGLLPETTTPAQGKGTKRGFGIIDLVRARVVARLKVEGVSVRTIRAVLAALGERWGVNDPLLQGGRLVVAGSELFWAFDDATLLNVLTGQLAARPLIILPMGEIISETCVRLLESCAA